MNNVVVYSSSTCPYCTLVKDFLDSKGVNYIEKNISVDIEARKELMKMGHMGVPVTIIKGTEIVGFNKDELESLIK